MWFTFVCCYLFHLKDLCTEELWPVIRATGADYEKVVPQDFDTYLGEESRRL